MFVEVRLDMESRRKRIPDQRSNFWRDFHDATSEYPRDIEDTEIDQMEQRFRALFPDILQNGINREVQRAWRNQDGRTGKPAPEIEVRLLSIEYGSLKAILDLTGISNNDLRDFVLSVLTVYSPIAFRVAMDSNVSMHASARVVGGDLRFTESVGSRGIDALGRAWVISNTSLLVPVGLALLICYVAFSATMHELEAVRLQNASAQAERAEVLKGLVAQNTKASDLMIAHANGSDLRALADVLIALSNSRIGNPSSTNSSRTAGP